MPKLTPFLWFAAEAEQAAEFYTSIFPNSSITNLVRYQEGGPGPAGMAMTVAFSLDGEPFVALNGQQAIPYTSAISFVIDCDTQAEVDHYWDRLSEGGAVQQCGWLTDRFGLTWQVVPRVLPQLLGNPDRAAAGRAMKAMLTMKKLDIAALQRAADGR